MATSLTASTLSVTLTENIKLNGVAQGASNTLSISSITSIQKRIATVTTSEVSILSFGTAISQGTFVAADVRYVRLTNKDDTNFIYLVFKNEYNNECCMKLDAGQSFIYNADANSGVIDTMLANQVALGFTEATGETNNPTSDVVSITATSKIIPGLRYTHDASGVPAGSSVGVTTPVYDADDGYRVTSHTLVSRDATTGAESAVSTSGPADTDGTGTYSSGFGDLSEITAEADTASCDIEIFVASV